MHHLTAAKRQDGSGWHYVSMRHGGGHPIGHCADHAPHGTEAQARECYSSFLRENVHLDAGTTNWMACAVCGAPTRTGARVADGEGFSHTSLCAEHLTRDNATEQLGLNDPAGDSWIS